MNSKFNMFVVIFFGLSGFNFCAIQSESDKPYNGGSISRIIWGITGISCYTTAIKNCDYSYTFFDEKIRSINKKYDSYIQQKINAACNESTYSLKWINAKAKAKLGRVAKCSLIPVCFFAGVGFTFAATTPFALFGLYAMRYASAKDGHVPNYSDIQNEWKQFKNKNPIFEHRK